MSQVVLNVGIDTEIIFIGGGLLMVNAMHQVKSMGFEVRAVVAPRHISEATSSGKKLSDELVAGQFEYDVIDEENVLSKLPWIDTKNKSYFGLCFGPAWIFSSSTLDIFDGNFFNFNGIPIPQYLGGAHYTWQILNRDTRMACHIQQITEKVDAGDIYLSSADKIESSVASSLDYFNANEKYGIGFIKKFFEMIKSREVFRVVTYLSIYEAHLYFPRLNTKKQGWINWDWNLDEIYRFCNAFDEPYIGAGTFIGSTELRFKKVTIAERMQFHPFCYGLIVRILKGHYFVATNGGLLKISMIKSPDNELLSSPKRGDRFHTPVELLQKAKSLRPIY